MTPPPRDTPFSHCASGLHQVEKLQQSLLSVESEVELLRSQLHAVNKEKLSHAQEVTDLQRKLQDAQNQVGTGSSVFQTLRLQDFRCFPVKP